MLRRTTQFKVMTDAQKGVMVGMRNSGRTVTQIANACGCTVCYCQFYFKYKW